MIDTSFMADIRELQRRCAASGQKTIAFGDFRDGLRCGPWMPTPTPTPKLRPGCTLVTPLKRFTEEQLTESIFTADQLAYGAEAALNSYLKETPTLWSLPNRFPYTKLRIRPMKPGPYKSSTHGPIPLSLRGRELLDGLRKAVVGAIAGDDFNADGQALSRARGEIAKYVSDLEDRALPIPMSRLGLMDRDKIYNVVRAYEGGQKTATEINARFLDQKRRYERDRAFRNVTFKWNPASDLSDALTFAFGDISSPQPLETQAKEIPVTDQKNEPAPKTRSQLIGEATHELVQAQRELEWILKDTASKPNTLYVSATAGPQSVGSFMRGAVAELVKEQWPTLTKKATARAKARVAKAEKAVSGLLT